MARPAFSLDFGILSDKFRPMILSFVFPSSSQRAGGVAMLFEFANAMARRGHEVHFIHGPALATRVDRVEDIPYDFDARVIHHITDTLDDPALPSAQIVFNDHTPRRLGQPVAIVQGFRLIGPAWDRAVFRAPCPKVCVASWLVDVGLAYGVPPEQLVHVPMGMDHELFAVRTPRSPRTFDVAMLYHPWYEKGWDIGRDILGELARRRSNFRAVVFSLAGPPPEPLPPGVELKLDLDQRRLADEVYNATRVFVQSSRHEGFGLTAIEAMACGAALVTTDCGGSRDYAFTDSTAVVVPPGDSGALTAAVDSLLDDPERADNLAAAGADSVRKFDWSRSAEELERFLLRYLEDPPRFQRASGEDRSEEYAL